MYEGDMMDDQGGDDSGYAQAMQRLAELKARPIDQLTEAEKKEKLCVTCSSNVKDVQGGNRHHSASSV
jgi:hypothetical protein